MRETVLFNDGMRAKYEIVSLGRPFFFLSAAISRIFPSTSYDGTNFILELRTTLFASKGLNVKCQFWMENK